MTNKLVKTDTLLGCFSYILRAYGKAKSPDAIVSGLAYTGRMSVEQFIEAAVQHLMNADLVSFSSLSDLPSQVLPAPLLLKNGQWAVLEKMGAKGVTVWTPEFQRQENVPFKSLSDNFSGNVFLVKPMPAFADSSLAISSPQSARSWFLSLLQQNLKTYSYVLSSSILINLFALASPLFIMNVYDRVIPNNAIETGWALAIGAGAVFVTDVIVRSLRGYFVDFAGRNLDITMNRTLFDKVLDMKFGYKPSSSGAFASMLREGETVREFFTSASLVALVDLPFSLFFLAITAVLSGWLSLIVLLLMVVSVGASLLLQMPLKRYVERTSKTSETKQGVLVETISGLETLKVLNANGRIKARYAAHVSENATASLRSRYYSALSVNAAIFVQQMAVVLVVLIGMYLVQDKALSAGALIACVMLSGRALSPITQVANLLSRYHQTMSALHTIEKIYLLPQEKAGGRDYLSRPELRGDVQFKEVSFSYPGNERLCLRDISFTVKEGERVGIIGRVGSGKSTIAKLLLHIYEPETGRILVDQTDADQIDPADLRKVISCVPQEVTLFRGTIRENITMSNPSASPEEILEASKLAGAHTFITSLPLGYDTPVGERGEGLSGGQRQAIALARAILARPKVLICDEPTNAMDSQAEENFARFIKGSPSGQTIILITHRTALLPLVDRLILVDNGKIVMDDKREKVLSVLGSSA